MDTKPEVAEEIISIKELYPDELHIEITRLENAETKLWIARWLDRLIPFLLGAKGGCYEIKDQNEVDLRLYKEETWPPSQRSLSR